jgi:pimeloyl-ACP methyl ester carboxylesterase
MISRLLHLATGRRVGLGAVALVRSLKDGLRGRVAVALAVTLVITACSAPGPMIEGEWIGDLRQAERSQRMEVSVDSSGRPATVSIAGSGLDRAPASPVPAGADSLGFTALAGTDTVRVSGAVRDGAWIGLARRGTDTAAFELRRLHPMSDAEWAAIIGSYRTSDGGLLGIAPFSEFGIRPLIVDYSSGRIGPLYPVAPNRFLVGHALINPTFPADTLELIFGTAGAVQGLRLSERDRAVVVAERLATRDEEVRFTSGPVTLSGMVTLPPGAGPHPALVLVHGSNALTREVFGPWSRYFAGLGYAVLAYDKRGTGQSTGDWKQADFAALGMDVLAGVRTLAARPDIRADRIGLWGASQAGWIMPLVAASAPGDVAFLIVHAGSGTTVREEGVLYLRNELRFAGLPESSVAIGTRYQELDDAVSKSGAGFAALQRYYAEHRKAEPWLWPPRAADDWFRPYYRMLMDFDPVPSWRRVKVPVLLFFGELDANVPPNESWPPIERALVDARNARVTQVLLAKANHLFLEARTGGRDEYPGLNRFVPGYFARMAQWLKEVTR